MGKRIECPVKRYPGYVILPDPMSWEQLSKWGDFVEGLGTNTFDNIHAEAQFIPSFVEEIHLEGFPNDLDKPPKHFKDFSAVLDWIVGEILAAINGDEITPFLEGGSTTGSKE